MKDEPTPSESVSVDEMMERLRDKRREAEGGTSRPKESRETVTRSDGSKVVKVRRRGSRKKTSSKDEESEKGLLRNKWFVLTAIVLLLLFAGGSLGFYFYQSARLNSPDFVRSISEKVEKTTGAKLKFVKFQVAPTSIRAESLSADWGSGGIAKSLEVKRLHGELDGQTYIFGKLVGESINAAEGTLVLETKPSLIGGAYGADIPNLFDFSSFRCSDLDVYFGPKAEAKMKLTGTRAALEFEGKSDSKLFVQDGFFHSPMFGKMELNQALIDFYPNRTELSSMVIKKEGSFGDISLSGTALKKDQSSRTFNVDLDSVDLATITQDRLVTVLKNCQVSATGGKLIIDDNGVWKMSANGTASGFDLTALPIMGNLGILVDDNNLSVTQFKENTKVAFSASNQTIKISGLSSERRGLFAIEVECEVFKGNQLRGIISVGLSPRYTERTNFMAKGAFSRSKGPYKWCDVKISGTLDAPTDNSTALFRISALQRDEAAQRLLEQELKRQSDRKERQKRLEALENKEEEKEELPKGAGDRFDELTR